MRNNRGNAGSYAGQRGPRAIAAAAAPLVWKFGGTSVANHDRLRAAAERMVAAHRSGRGVVAVLSAMGHTTDELVAKAAEITDRPPLRELDALLSVGETISCALAAMAITELGESAISLSGAQAGIRTDDQHGDARLRDIQPDRIHRALAEGAIVLVTGFQGATDLGDVTTLGRGGSDASAVALAAALGATECEIFTDVRAVYTADPRLVPDAQPRTTIRHEEMLEMAEAGAAVLQPRAVELAIAHQIDIHLRSSFTADAGTWIRRAPSTLEATSDGGSAPEVAGIAHRRHESLYTVKDLDTPELAMALAARGINLGALIPDTPGLRFTAPGAPTADVTSALDAAGASVRMDHELSSVSVITPGITRKPHITAQALAALHHAGIAPHLLHTTPARITVLIDTQALEDTVRLLHNTFIPSTPDAWDNRAVA
ncbi:MAG TPA: aspartate kinase [Pseudonocardia sp.]|nr:aspartate kinase [Pseudonocardia sp.]